MTWSLNEIDATAKKAARGAGYDWGLAEETGKAVRWLCSYGFNGCTALATLLRATDGAAYHDIAPQIGPDNWHARGPALCPIATGAALSDHAATLINTNIRIQSVHAPLLILPFVNLAARQTKTPLTATWANCSFSTDGTSVSLQGAPTHDPNDMTMTRGAAPTKQQSTTTRTTPDPTVWSILNTFANRTYAPATEASRLLGAGAGLSDND